MLGEQSSICRYKTEGLDIEIRMTVQLERAVSPYGDVAIEHHHEHTIPEELQDELYQRIHNGVHGGYALSDVPYIPDTCLIVKILELSVTPPPHTLQNANEQMSLGYLLEATISGMVETLLRSLENLRTGKESYYRT